MNAEIDISTSSRQLTFHNIASRSDPEFYLTQVSMHGPLTRIQASKEVHLPDEPHDYNDIRMRIEDADSIYFLWGPTAAIV